MKSNKKIDMYLQLADFAKIFNSPKRLAIVDILRGNEFSVGEITKALSIPQANASQHLAFMKTRGILKSRRDGKTIYYSLSTLKFIDAYDLISRILAEKLKYQRRHH